MSDAPETENPPAAPLPVAKSAPKPFGDLSDWVLLVGILGSVPLLWFAMVDLWYRTDCRFFPVLIITSIFLVATRAKLGSCETPARSYWALGAISLGAVAGLLAALNFSGWLAASSIVLVVLGWMWLRLGNTPMYQAVGWILPALVFLVLPISDATDLTRSLETSVASAASAGFDMLGVAHLAENGFIESESGRISAGKALRGFGSPYLFLAAVVLLCIFRKVAPSVGLLTVLSVPLWVWFGGVLHILIGVYLWEEQDRNIFAGGRNTMVQIGVFTLLLGLVWLFQLSLKTLLTPFPKYSTNTNDVHKIFNKLVTWPAPDPAKRRRVVEEEEAEAADMSFLSGKPFIAALAVAGLVLAGSGVYAGMQAFGGEADRLTPLSLTDEGVENALTAESLPADLGGMRQAAFEVFHNEDQYFQNRHIVSWLYLKGSQRIRVTVGMMGRGFYPVELDYESPIRTISAARVKGDADIPGIGNTLIDEFELLDDIYGRSYVAYATINLAGKKAFRTAATETQPSMQELGNMLAIQPTILKVQLFAESTGVLIDEEREQYRVLLAKICETLAGPLQAAAGMNATK